VKYRFWKNESKYKTKMDLKYWNMNVWTERMRITMGCRGGLFWTLVRNTYLQVSVASPSEQCYVLTSSSGGSF